MLRPGDKPEEVHMIYTKTDAGRAEVQARSQSLTAVQRQVLILCDGKRRVEDLERMVAPGILAAALDHLARAGLLAVVEEAPRAAPPAAEPTATERFRAAVALATSMAADLGFTTRVRTQLQIEKAQSMEDLAQVVDLLCKHLQDTPLMSLRLGQLRQLARA